MTEIPVDRYVTPSAQYVTVESGQTASVHFSNILKKFRVHVVKSDVDTGTAQGDATLPERFMAFITMANWWTPIYHRAGWQLYDPLLCLRR